MNRLTSTLAFVAAAFLGGCAALPQSTHLASAPETDEKQSPAPRLERAPRFVQGDLDITNRTSLEEFADLEVVTGTLTIVGNTRLHDLAGLEHLRAVKELVVQDNLGLTDIEGLRRLRHARSVTIAGNPRLESLHGLESLRTVDRLVVSDNGIYCTTGLSGLRQAGDVVIASNPRLISLRGLKHLTAAHNVSIVNNPRLSADGGLLEALDRVSGRLTLEGNAGLHPDEVRAVRERVAGDLAVASR